MKRFSRRNYNTSNVANNTGARKSKFGKSKSSSTDDVGNKMLESSHSSKSQDDRSKIVAKRERAASIAKVIKPRSRSFTTGSAINPFKHFISQSSADSSESDINFQQLKSEIQTPLQTPTAKSEVDNNRKKSILIKSKDKKDSASTEPGGTKSPGKMIKNLPQTGLLTNTAKKEDPSVHTESISISKTKETSGNQDIPRNLLKSTTESNLKIHAEDATMHSRPIIKNTDKIRTCRGPILEQENRILVELDPHNCKAACFERKLHNNYLNKCSPEVHFVGTPLNDESPYDISKKKISICRRSINLPSNRIKDGNETPQNRSSIISKRSNSEYDLIGSITTKEIKRCLRYSVESLAMNAACDDIFETDSSHHTHDKRRLKKTHFSSMDLASDENDEQNIVQKLYMDEAFSSLIVLAEASVACDEVIDYGFEDTIRNFAVDIVVNEGFEFGHSEFPSESLVSKLESKGEMSNADSEIPYCKKTLSSIVENIGEDDIELLLSAQLKNEENQIIERRASSLTGSEFSKDSFQKSSMTRDIKDNLQHTNRDSLKSIGSTNTAMRVPYEFVDPTSQQKSGTFKKIVNRIRDVLKKKKSDIEERPFSAPPRNKTSELESHSTGTSNLGIGSSHNPPKSEFGSWPNCNTKKSFVPEAEKIEDMLLTYSPNLRTLHSQSEERLVHRDSYKWDTFLMTPYEFKENPEVYKFQCFRKDMASETPNFSEESILNSKRGPPCGAENPDTPVQSNTSIDNLKEYLTSENSDEDSEDDMNNLVDRYLQKSLAIIKDRNLLIAFLSLSRKLLVRCQTVLDRRMPAGELHNMLKELSKLESLNQTIMRNLAKLMSLNVALAKDHNSILLNSYTEDDKQKVNDLIDDWNQLQANTLSKLATVRALTIIYAQVSGIADEVESVSKLINNIGPDQKLEQMITAENSSLDQYKGRMNHWIDEINNMRDIVLSLPLQTFHESSRCDCTDKLDRLKFKLNVLAAEFQQNDDDNSEKLSSKIENALQRCQKLHDLCQECENRFIKDKHGKCAEECSADILMDTDFGSIITDLEKINQILKEKKTNSEKVQHDLERCEALLNSAKQTYSQDSKQTYSQDARQAYSHDSRQIYPQDARQAYSHDSRQIYSQDGKEVVITTTRPTTSSERNQDLISTDFNTSPYGNYAVTITTTLRDSHSAPPHIHIDQDFLRTENSTLYPFLVGFLGAMLAGFIYFGLTTFVLMPTISYDRPPPI